MRLSGWVSLGVCVLLLMAPAWAQDPAATQPAQTLPGLTIDREAGHVDLEAEVVGRETEWLELLACTPNSREHESILTVTARPQHVHLALLLLGLEPGRPMRWERREQPAEGEPDVITRPPQGPEVAVTVLYEHDGRRHEVPANEWIIHRETGEPLRGNRWLFAGSRFRTHEEQRYYMADLNGTVISLVNFGDDLLARQTTTTNRNDQQAWLAAAERIPPRGTPVTIRLTPAPPRNP